MSAGYSKVRHILSDRFLPQVKEIVGPYMLERASFEMDTREATDMVTTIKSGDFRLSVRVREPGYFDRYPDDFTVRSWIKSGAESELSKIERGFVDWMFYSHALTESERDGFRRWWLFNLDAFRLHWGAHDSGVASRELPNPDGATKLRTFLISSFPNNPPLIIAQGPACPSCGALLQQQVGADFIHSWCDKAVGHFDSWRALNGLKLASTPLFQKSRRY